MLFRALLVIVLLSEIASADLRRISIYGETTLSIGATWGETTSIDRNVNPPVVLGIEDRDGTLLDARFALGVVFGGESGLNLRVGPALDLFKTTVHDGHGAAIGIESQGDWPVTSSWRIGGRLAISNGTAKSSPSGGDGRVFIAGVRARSGVGVVGIDGIFVRPRDDGYVGFSNGMLATAGLGLGGSGRSGKYAVAIAAGGALAVLVVGVIAFSVSGCCGR